MVYNLAAFITYGVCLEKHHHLVYPLGDVNVLVLSSLVVSRGIMRITDKST